MPVLIWSQVHSLSRRIKILNAIAIVFTTWSLAGSWSRGPWLAGMVSVIWLLILEKRLINWRTIATLLMGILLFLLSSFLWNPNVRAFGKNGDAEITGTNGRDKMWSSAVKGILQQPLTGWGSPALWRIMATQNDAYLVPESQDTENWKVYRVPKGPDSAPSFVIENKNGERHGLDFTMNKTHNEFLDYAATYGVPALLLFAAIIGMSIWGSRNVMPGISASIVSYAIYLLTWPEIVRFAPIAWFLIGIALASYQNGSIFKANRGYVQSGIL
ncbi:hypothetical protein BXU09_04650 [Deinococcus sp. LM3]|nr:hypothetical protein BXU09_04650 [Deinococcus sp. LM3]